MIRKRLDRGDSADGALEYVERALDKRGVTAFDRDDAAQRDEAVRRTIAASLDQLLDRGSPPLSQSSPSFRRSRDPADDAGAALGSRRSGYRGLRAAAGRRVAAGAGPAARRRHAARRHARVPAARARGRRGACMRGWSPDTGTSDAACPTPMRGGGCRITCGRRDRSTSCARCCCGPTWLQAKLRAVGPNVCTDFDLRARRPRSRHGSGGAAVALPALAADAEPVCPNSCGAASGGFSDAAGRVQSAI